MAGQDRARQDRSGQGRAEGNQTMDKAQVQIKSKGLEEMGQFVCSTVLHRTQ